MDRIVVILDQMRGKYSLISGSNQAQIEIDRKCTNPKKGFTKLLDRNLPFVKNEKLNVGPDGDLVYTIRCNRTGQWQITGDEFVWLDKIFRTGPGQLRRNIEKVASQIKSSQISSSEHPLKVNLLINAVFPYIMELVEEQLCELERTFPYIQIEVHATTNISKKLDKSLGKVEDSLLRAWEQTVSGDLSSAYDPEFEFEQRWKNYERGKKALSIADGITNEDIRKALEIIEKERLYYKKHKRLGILGDWPKLSAGH
jgi:hypothetical protein